MLDGVKLEASSHCSPSPKIEGNNIKQIYISIISFSNKLTTSVDGLYCSGTTKPIFTHPVLSACGIDLLESKKKKEVTREGNFKDQLWEWPQVEPGGFQVG